MIYCSDVDGVYNSAGEAVKKITPENFTKVKKDILGASTTDVTGGMIHKVEEALAIAKKYKIPTLIINGNISGNLYRAIMGTKVEGTEIF